MNNTHRLLKSAAILAASMAATPLHAGVSDVEADVAGDTVQIGNIDVIPSVGGGIKMKFTFNADYQFLDEWYDFRWVQVAILVTVNGVPQNPAPLFGPIPCIDPHSGQNVPGALNPAGQGDDSPYYFNDTNWDKNQPPGCHVEKTGSTFSDKRANWAAGTVITFDTFLVVSNETDSFGMGPTQFCILRGIRWTYTQNTGATAWTASLLPVQANADEINNAIGNTIPAFAPGWEAQVGCVLSACVNYNYCPEDCIPPGGNSNVNIDDLLGVINHWGSNPGQFDITPPGGNGIVNIDDMLKVINGWGPCPPPPVPANDNCRNSIPAVDGNTAFDSKFATTDGPPHPLGCDLYDDPGIYKDIWYHYFAAFDGVLHVSLCGSAFDTVLAVYQGVSCPVSDANLLACSDDACDLQSHLDVATQSGQGYLIRIGGYEGASGVGTMSVSFTYGQPPPNDLCANAITVVNGSNSWNNANANTDGPPACAAITRDVWFNYTATCTGLLTISTVGTPPPFTDTVLEAFDSTGCNPLGSLLGCNDDINFPGNLLSYLIIPVTTGQQIKIRCGSWGTDLINQGPASLNISCQFAND